MTLISDYIFFESLVIYNRKSGVSVKQLNNWNIWVISNALKKVPEYRFKWTNQRRGVQLLKHENQIHKLYFKNPNSEKSNFSWRLYSAKGPCPCARLSTRRPQRRAFIFSQRLDNRMRTTIQMNEI